MWVVLAGLSSGLAFSVFARGGIEFREWCVSGLVVGVAGMIWVFRRRRAEWVPGLDRVCLWALAGMVAIPALQVIPIPVGVLDWISPVRAEMARFVGREWAPVSVNVEATKEHLVRILVFVLTFVLARELSWRFEPGRFWAAAPLIGIAGLEAVLGLVQAAGDGAAVARGTYPNRNHFAGLMEMAMPFALAWGVAVLHGGKRRFESPARPVLIACGLFGVAALMLVAVLGSLSRMGFLGSLAGLGVTGMLLMLRPGRRWVAATVGAPAVLGVAAFVFLPSDSLILRFADIASTEEISRDTRSEIWENTVRMIEAYPWAGAGYGAYEDAFTAFQTAAPMNTVDYAHNDYLQVAAEAGVVGLLLLGVLGWRVTAGVMGAVRREDAGRYAAAGCCGALVAMGLHGLTDFNLYIPANGMAMAWVCGVGASYLNTRYAG